MDFDDTDPGRYRDMVESAPDAMIMIDSAGRVVFANAQTERLFGYQRAELVGQPVEILIPERLRERHVGHRARFAADPRVRPMGNGQALVGRRVDGSEFPVEISLSPIAGDAGRRVTAAIRDVTDRKEAERLLHQASLLERSHRELEQFAYMASHDLQAPLRNIVNLTQLLREELAGQMSPAAGNFLGLIENSAAGLRALILDILELSRAVRSTRPRVEVELDSVVAQACARLQSLIDEKRAEISCGALPRVWGDPALLVQLFQNLLSNGIKFQPPGRVPRIEISARREGRSWEIAVQDNGIGIAREHLPRLFEIFQRFHSLLENPGNGIGLAICKRIVEERHGGRIWAECDAGAGARFLFAIAALPEPAALEA